jgi:poly(A) polymerase
MSGYTEHKIDTQSLHLLQQTAHYLSEQHQQAYLVGGSLRNILLGEDCVDWDIATPGDAHKLARRLADRLGGHYVRMHEKASRVVVVLDTDSTTNKKHKKEIRLDISPQNGKTIEDDLRQRDFTINAIAVPLANIVKYLESELPGRGQAPPLQYHEGADSFMAGAGLAPTTTSLPADALGLIDPFHGLADLQARRLKAVDGEIFRHDPLRMLRAVRLMMRYGLEMDGWTEGLMVRDAALLPQVAAERVHDELYAILEPDGASERLRFLDAHGLFTVIFPEFVAARGMRQPAPHYWDVLEHSIESVGALERVARLVQGETEQAEHPHRNIVGAPLAGALGGDSVGAGALGADLVGAGALGADLVGAGALGAELMEIRALLREAQQQGIYSFAALTAPRMKLAALLHDIGKPVTYSRDEEGEIHFYNHPQAGVPIVEQIMKRLCASTQDRRLAQLVAAHHMRPGQLAQGGPVTPRAIRRYFVDLGPTGIYIALLSLADHLATLGPQPATGSWERHLGVVLLLFKRYIRERQSILPPQPISPQELMRRLQLQPGPVIGQLLDLIAEAQAEGTIHSKEEAVWLAEEKLNELRPYPETWSKS